MAIAPTGAIYKTFTFDSQSSSTYGVYITGAAVYNAPERDVEMIEIPGRNGAFAFDKGRFQNIEVTYPAGIFADNETNWAEAISNLRNMLCSRKGYCRLTDDYNPNEYRMAVYKSGLEVDPAQLRAGEFNITFECMPQRWLTSGETKQTIAQSGDTITNPTLFDASPLLEINGYGDLTINGGTLSIMGGALGNVQIFSGQTWQLAEVTFDIDDTFLNAGDEITTADIAYIRMDMRLDSGEIDPSDYGIFHWYSGTQVGDFTSMSYRTQVVNEVTIKPNSRIKYGTAQTWTAGTNRTVPTVDYGNISMYYGADLVYDGAKSILIRLVCSASHFSAINQKTNVYSLYANSSQSALGNPLYFDLDIGEAYKIENGVAVSVNNNVTIPAALPKLAPGSNTITFDNTITQLKIVPRWWKI